MKCNKCGLENIDNAKFCAHCGEKLEPTKQNKKCQICGSENEGSAKFCATCGSKLETSTELKKCQICGSENEEGTKYCAVCGSQLSSRVYSYTAETVKEDVKEDKFSTTSMVVGIVSISTTVLCCMFPFGLIGGIVSVILGILSVARHQSNGKAIAGIVCGAVAFAIGLIMIIGMISIMNDPEYLERLEEFLKQYESIY